MLLLRKELRALRPFLWLIFVLAGLDAVATFATEFPDQHTIADVFDDFDAQFAYFMLFAIAFAIGQTLVGREKNEGTLEFIDALPVSRARVYWTKWLAGYLKDRDMVPGDDFSFFEFPTINPEAGSAVVAGVDGMVISNTGGNAEDAKRLGAWLVSDIDVQTQWVKTKGSLSPNSKIDKSIYNIVQNKAVEAVESTDHFTFNYDLTTTPPMAEVGLNMFTEFLDDPTDYMGMLERTEAQAKEIFDK